MQVLKFKDVDEAIERANSSSYGLAAGVITPNIERAIQISNSLRAGTVWCVLSVVTKDLPRDGARK